jgi:hypothetical protein
MRRPRARPPDARTRLTKHLAVALASLCVTALLAEGAARWFAARFAPAPLVDGIFVSQLPHVSIPWESPVPVSSGLLPRRKAEGEVRVAVFGESSVKGDPLDGESSAPVMTHDALRPQLGADRLTVINAGQGGSTIVNTYYDLLFLKDFDLDVVVFYLGANDLDVVGGEICLPVSAPALHGAWRWLVARSRLLWLARVPWEPWLAPAPAQGEVTPEPQDQEDCRASSFPLWADALVELAVRAGAKVIVTTPVRSALAYVDWAPDVPCAATSPEVRALLACVLSQGCDLSARLPPAHEARRALDADMDALSSAWEQAAARHGARVVDLRDELTRRSRGGVLGPDFIVDDVHLSGVGYLLLARLWSAEILHWMRGGERGPVATPSLEEARPYEARCEDPYVAKAAGYMDCGAFLLAARGLVHGARACAGRDCAPDPAPLLEALRRCAGLVE